LWFRKVKKFRREGPVVPVQYLFPVDIPECILPERVRHLQKMALVLGFHEAME
jgi:hypothetical protein